MTKAPKLVLLRRQPYLASVLPMYAFFALLVFPRGIPALRLDALHDEALAFNRETNQLAASTAVLASPQTTNPGLESISRASPLRRTG